MKASIQKPDVKKNSESLILQAVDKHVNAE